MTPPQVKFYFRLWGMAHKAQPDLDRKVLHAELGLPESHTGFSQKHFDTWKAHCLALAQPANFRAQIKQASMPATRRRVFLRHLLAAMQEDESYAEATIVRMHRGLRYITTGRSVATFGTIGEDDLERLMIALKKECRRRWPKKENLLGTISDLRGSEDFDEAAAGDAVCAALNVPQLRCRVDQLVYEDLLIVLSALRGISGRAVQVVADADPDWSVA